MDGCWCDSCTLEPDKSGRSAGRMSLRDPATQLKQLYMAGNKKIKYISKKQKAVPRKKPLGKIRLSFLPIVFFFLLLSPPSCDLQQLQIGNKNRITGGEDERGRSAVS